MIATDSNALNSYLKTPPLFGTGRETGPVYPVSPARQLPSAIGEHGNDAEERAVPARFAPPRRDPGHTPRHAVSPEEAPEARYRAAAVRYRAGGDTAGDQELDRLALTRLRLLRAAGGHAAASSLPLAGLVVATRARMPAASEPAQPRGERAGPEAGGRERYRAAPLGSAVKAARGERPALDIFV